MIIKLLGLAFLAMALEIVGPEAVLAQAGNPANPADSINNPHPVMPWSFSRRIDYGQVIRYIEVPPQSVVIVVPVALPDGVPRRNEPRVETIPGYIVTAATT